MFHQPCYKGRQRTENKTENKKCFWHCPECSAFEKSAQREASTASSKLRLYSLSQSIHEKDRVCVLLNHAQTEGQRHQKPYIIWIWVTQGWSRINLKFSKREKFGNPTNPTDVNRSAWDSLQNWEGALSTNGGQNAQSAVWGPASVRTPVQNNSFILSPLFTIQAKPDTSASH